MECQVKKGIVNYEIKGEGYPLVILHSMGTDHRSMTAWLEPVLTNYAIPIKRIYIDIPAHGKSKINNLVNSTEDILNNILECLKYLLPEETFAIIGFSYGGYLAKGVFHYLSTRVKGLALLASALHMKERQLPDKVILIKDESLLNSLEADIRKAIETLMIDQTETSIHRFFEEIQPGRLLANREFLTSDWREKGYLLPDEPFSNVLAVSIPVLLVAGKQDAICGYKDYYSLLEKMPHASFVILDRAGHLLPIDQRELLQQHVLEWLSRVNKYIKIKEPARR